MRTLLLMLLVLVAGGCGTDSSFPEQTTSVVPPVAVNTSYDPEKTGSITGRVSWHGPFPTPPQFTHRTPKEGGGFQYRNAENPNRPNIAHNSRAVSDAVVFLRTLDASKARSWDLPKVTVEMASTGIVVVQGEHRGRSGFVRRGDSISMISTESVYHVLRGRGDAFFRLTLPQPNQPISRTLVEPGRVELSSGSGLYWLRADLFVTDHPYYTHTNKDGSFTLNNVPVGPAEVIVWLPGWESVATERDPDSQGISRMTYSPPIEKVATVMVEAKQTTTAEVIVP